MSASRIACVLFCLATAVCASGAPNPSALWNKHCSECHGKDGRGRTKEGRRLNITDLSNRQVQAFISDEQATRAIKQGIRDDKGEIMHPVGASFSDDEVKALVRHFRSLARKK